MTNFVDPPREEFRHDAGRTVVYSGLGNHDRALALGKEVERIEDTPGGKKLNDEKVFDYYKVEYFDRLKTHYRDRGNNEVVAKNKAYQDCEELARAHWDPASRNYASCAEGDVRTYVVGGKAAGTFRQVELPALLENPKVSSINGVPREELKKLYDADPSVEKLVVLNRICEAELVQDARRVAETGDPQLAEDLQVRQRRFETLGDLQEQKHMFEKQSVEQHSTASKDIDHAESMRAKLEARSRGPANAKSP